MERWRHGEARRRDRPAALPCVAQNRGRTYERAATFGGALLVSVNGRHCCAVGSSRGMNLCGSLAMPAARLDVKTNRGLINFLNVWKWKQTLNSMMKKVKKMFSGMMQSTQKPPWVRRTSTAAKMRSGTVAGAIVPDLLCAILNDEKEMRDVVQRLSCPIWT